MAQPSNRGARQPILCKVPECGRRNYTQGLCQTHSRQARTTGTIKPIRRSRRRFQGTVKFAGLRLSPDCARRLNGLAEERGLSVGATIADVLETAVLKRPGTTAAMQRKKT